MPAPIKELPGLNGPIERAVIDREIDRRLAEDSKSLEQNNASAKIVIDALQIVENDDAITKVKNCIRKRQNAFKEPNGEPPTKRKRIGDVDNAIKIVAVAADGAEQEVDSLQRTLAAAQWALKKCVDMSAKKATEDNIAKAQEAQRYAQALQANVDCAAKHADEMAKLKAALEEERKSMFASHIFEITLKEIKEKSLIFFHDLFSERQQDHSPQEIAEMIGQMPFEEQAIVFRMAFLSTITAIRSPPEASKLKAKFMCAINVIQNDQIIAVYIGGYYTQQNYKDVVGNKHATKGIPYFFAVNNRDGTVDDAPGEYFGSPDIGEQSFRYIGRSHDKALQNAKYRLCGNPFCRTDPTRNKMMVIRASRRISSGEPIVVAANWDDVNIITAGVIEFENDETMLDDSSVGATAAALNAASNDDTTMSPATSKAATSPAAKAAKAAAAKILGRRVNVEKTDNKADNKADDEADDEADDQVDDEEDEDD